MALLSRFANNAQNQQAHTTVPSRSQLIVEVSKRVQKDLLGAFWDYQSRIFLCGAASTSKGSLRHRLAQELVQDKLVSIHYPENLFDELLSGVGHHDLLSLENVLAEGVTAIVVVLESAGALTELGAFANHERLREKLVVVQDKRHTRDRSFIQMGPVRLLREANPKSVIDADFGDMKAVATQVRNVVRSRRWMLPKYSPNNLFHIREFILPTLYVLQSLSRWELVAALQSVENLDRRSAEAIVTGALSTLLAERLIVMTPSGYVLTSDGAAMVRPVTGATRRRRMVGRRDDVLDSLRIKVLHELCRRQRKKLVGS